MSTNVPEELKQEEFVYAMHGKRYGGKIEGWVIALQHRGCNGVIVGRVHDDPRRPDDDPFSPSRIVTTSVVVLDPEHRFAVTKNTFYLLGKKGGPT